MIRVTGTLTCANPAEAETVRTLLPEHIRLSRDEPGCLSFEVVPTKDPLVWQLDESFASHEAFAAHQARTRASPWFKATADLTRDFKVTEV